MIEGRERLRTTIKNTITVDGKPFHMRPGAKIALPYIGKNRSELNLEVTNNVSQISKKRKIHYKNTLILPLRLDRKLWHSDFAEEFQPDRILSTVKNIKE